MSSSTRIIGTLRRMPDGKGAVRMEDVYDTEIDDLWSAITDPDRLSRWIADVKGDLRAGGQIHARFTSTWEGPGRIETCQAPHHLVLVLEPGTPDETVIEATLAAEHDRTRLVVEERGLPLDVLAGHGSGWQAHVEDLATYLRGDQPGDWKTRWTALTPAYQELAVGPA
jgi:uncharacterized protein YndB with AHSA1/START domain